MYICITYKKNKAQPPVGFDPTTSHVLGGCSNN